MICPISHEGVTNWREPIACAFLPKKEKKKTKKPRRGAERNVETHRRRVQFVAPKPREGEKNTKRTNICLQAPNEQVFSSAGGPETNRADGECFFFLSLDRWSSPPSAALRSASAFRRMRWWCPSFRAGSVHRGNCLFYGRCVYFLGCNRALNSLKNLYTRGGGAL